MSVKEYKEIAEKEIYDAEKLRIYDTKCRPLGSHICSLGPTVL